MAVRAQELGQEGPAALEPTKEAARIARGRQYPLAGLVSHQSLRWQHRSAGAAASTGAPNTHRRRGFGVPADGIPTIAAGETTGRRLRPGVGPGVSFRAGTDDCDRKNVSLRSRRRIRSDCFSDLHHRP